MAFPASPESFGVHRPAESGRIESMTPPASEDLVASMLVVAVAASRGHVHMSGVIELHRLVPVGETSQGHGLRHTPLGRRAVDGSPSRPRIGGERGGNASQGKESDRQENPSSHSFLPLPGNYRSLIPYSSSFSPSVSFASSFAFFPPRSFFPPKYASMGLHPKKAVFPAIPRSFSNASAPVRSSSTPRA